jgi:hypothetical protein
MASRELRLLRRASCSCHVSVCSGECDRKRPDSQNVCVTRPDEDSQARVDDVPELREQRARLVARLRELKERRVETRGVRRRRRPDRFGHRRKPEVVDVVVGWEERSGGLAQVVRVTVAHGVE